MARVIDVAGKSDPERSTNAFWVRLVDNAFRRKVLFVLPIVALTALGVLEASREVPLYESSAVLSAATNPLVTDQAVRGVTVEFWESTAEGTSRIINEQLRTDAFATEVASRAGLGDALEVGFITPRHIRSNVWASADGTSLITVNAQWGDPETAHQLVNAAIATYQDYVAQTVARDSIAAVAYYEGVRSDALAEFDAAKEELELLLDELPEVVVESDRPIRDALRIQTLTDQIDGAAEDVAAAESQIDAAELASLQSQSEAGRSLQVIDEPQVPFAPQSTLTSAILVVGSLFLLGVAVAFAALVVTTLLDRSVSTSAELAAIGGISLVATVPPIDMRSRGGARLRRRPERARKRGASDAQPADPDGTVPAAEPSALIADRARDVTRT